MAYEAKKESIPFTTDMNEAEAAIGLANAIKDLPDDEQLPAFRLMTENTLQNQQEAFAAQYAKDATGRAMLTFINAKNKGKKNG